MTGVGKTNFYWIRFILFTFRTHIPMQMHKVALSVGFNIELDLNGKINFLKKSIWN